MEVLNELKELWLVLIALPGAVWLNALYLFIAVGLLKAAGVVRQDAGAAAANAIFAIAVGGGFEGLTDLTAALNVSAVAVIGAVYYKIWKWKVGGWFAGLFASIKAKLPSKE